MSTQILINATYPEEVRVAIKKDNQLYNYDNDRLDNVNKKGCIFKGVVSRVEPSLDAAFIDFGRAKHGFLPLSEVVKSHKRIDLNNDAEDSSSEKKAGISSYLKEGQSIIVQVEKDERGTKGAALTTNISLAGCFVVLMPNTSGAGGISRQIDGEDRDQLKRILNQIDVPSYHSLILRTASVNKTLEELLWDYNVLVSHWDAISQVASESTKPLLLYKEGALLQRTIRDYLKPDVDSIIVDSEATYKEVLALVQNARPDFLEKVKLYSETTRTLFDAHEIEYDVESLYNSEVSLSNGATLVIDHCEALTAIDINSAKATKSADIEETAFNINKASAYEIARQMRLRNLGGQIVIDFIDMTSTEHRREVENAFKQAIEEDKARIQVGSICDKLGLLALSRQRMNTSLDEASLVKCKHCHGHGVHRRPVSVALSLVRLLKSQAAREKADSGVRYILKCPAPVAELLYNNYKTELSSIELEYKTPITIKINDIMGTSDFEIETKRKASASKVYRNYEKQNAPAEDEILIPAVKAFTSVPKEKKPKEQNINLLTRIYNAFFGQSTSSSDKNQSDEDSYKKKRRYGQRNSNTRRHGKRTNHNRRNDQSNNADQEKNLDKKAVVTKNSEANGNVRDSNQSTEPRTNNRRRRPGGNNNNRRRQGGSRNNQTTKVDNKD